MLNFVFEPATCLGLLFGSSMISLYIIKFFRPILTFDEDILFTTVGLIYSSIIIIHGWRLDPILLFSQILIIIIALAAGYASLKLRVIIFILCSELKLELKDYKNNSFLFWTDSIIPSLKKNKKLIQSLRKDKKL